MCVGTKISKLLSNFQMTTEVSSKKGDLNPEGLMRVFANPDLPSLGSGAIIISGKLKTLGPHFLMVFFFFFFFF